MAKRHVASFGGDEDVLKLTVVADAKLYEDTKNHLIVHFKQVNCMVYKLYPIEVIIFLKRNY